MTCDIVDTFATHSSLLHAVTDCWAQNCSTDVMFPLFSNIYFIRRYKKLSEYLLFFNIFYPTAIGKAHDAVSIHFPFKSKLDHVVKG